MYGTFLKRFVQTSSKELTKLKVRKELIEFCQERFGISDYRVKSLMLRWPNLQKITEKKVSSVVDCINNIGADSSDILKAPLLLNVHPQTIKYRYYTLKECGLVNINMVTLSKFVAICNKTVRELKIQELIPQELDVWENLIGCFDRWPEFQESCRRYRDWGNCSLYRLRREILQRFFGYRFGITPPRFDAIENTYYLFKNKPLNLICENIDVLLKEVNFTDERIVSHIFVLFTDTDNLRKMVSEVREIGGVDIKDVLFKFPTIINRNYEEIMRIKDILKAENIPDEAIRKCFKIFNLSVKTVQERITEVKNHPKLKDSIRNPRFLILVTRRNKVMKRLSLLEESNEGHCSLHKLISYEEEFNRFISSTSDKNKGTNLTAVIDQYLPLNKDSIKEQFLRQPYRNCVPPTLVTKNFELLSKTFTDDEITENCILLLYPPDEITTGLQQIERLRRCVTEKEKSEIIPEYLSNCAQLDFNKLTNSQILSYVLYTLEKNHVFSGDGVWPKNNIERLYQ